MNTIDIMNKISKFLLKVILYVTESEGENILVFSLMLFLTSFKKKNIWNKNEKIMYHSVENWKKQS